MSEILDYASEYLSGAPRSSSLHLVNPTASVRCFLPSPPSFKLFSSRSNLTQNESNKKGKLENWDALAEVEPASLGCRRSDSATTATASASLSSPEFEHLASDLNTQDLLKETLGRLPCRHCPFWNGGSFWRADTVNFPGSVDKEI